MAISIKQPIVKASLKKAANLDTSVSAPAVGEKPLADVIQMHERLERPEMLLGSTYKVKTPLSEHALYVTINDIVLNPGTEHELRRPFEIFINSKNMEHFQWIVALTRIISAVFRKGGDVTFLVEELHSVFDPKGGYFKRGGKYMPSLVAEIGDAIESHLVIIGLLKRDEPDEHLLRHLEEKRREFERVKVASSTVEPGTTVNPGLEITSTESEPPELTEGTFPAGSRVCDQCQTKASILMDGCMTCLHCGYSKCS